MEPLSLTISALAEILGVPRKTLSKITNEGGAVTPDMALRLSKAFNTTAEFWLNLQRNYDLFKATVELTEATKHLKATVKFILEDKL